MSMFGSFSSWLRAKLKKEQKAKILILGLDAAGKTTLTRYMRFGKFAGTPVGERRTRASWSATSVRWSWRVTC